MVTTNRGWIPHFHPHQESVKRQHNARLPAPTGERRPVAKSNSTERLETCAVGHK